MLWRPAFTPVVLQNTCALAQQLQCVVIYSGGVENRDQCTVDCATSRYCIVSLSQAGKTLQESHLSLNQTLH